MSETEMSPEVIEIAEIQIPIAETINTEKIEPIETTTVSITETPATTETLDVNTSVEAPENSIITPEHVAEVKTELSEQRRAGFRFFVQKKTKIMAGVSFLIVSISAGVLFSSSFLSTDIQKSGKSNIQEVIKNAPVIPVATEEMASGAITETIISTDTLPAEIVNYEAGIDYAIIKNTKKNISTRKIPETLTGAEIPTP